MTSADQQHPSVPLGRLVCLVDGFNVYHSLGDAAAKLGAPASTKWLDMWRLLDSHRSAVRNLRVTLCGTVIPRHEEKETDVAISIKILELLIRDEADAVMIVSGDTDLMPAIRAARSLYPTKPIGCLFPFNRVNNELKNVCSFYSSIGAEQYAKYQFPDH